MTYVVKKPVREFKFKKKPLLNHIDIELTERCNNNCIHCLINLPEHDSNAKERELTTGELKEILEEAASLGCFSVRFTGGEPLLREDFEEIYIFTRKLGMNILIFTNASLITKRLAEVFKKIPPGDTIEVTLYGMKEKSYEEITCNKGSFYSAKNGINLLLEYNIPFIVKGVILPQNRNETEEFETYASTIPWMSKPPAYSMFFDLRARRDKKNELIKKIRMTPEEGINILTRKKETYIKGIKQFCSIFSSPPGDKLFRCGAGAGKGSIDPYGNFQLCLLLREPSYNLKKGNLKECLTGFFPKIREVKAENPDYLRRCAKCFLKSLCEQCPAKSRSEHGTLDTPVEYFCDITHKQAEYLGLVKNGEKTWEVQNWKERVDNFS